MVEMLREVLRDAFPVFVGDVLGDGSHADSQESKGSPLQQRVVSAQGVPPPYGTVGVPAPLFPGPCAFFNDEVVGAPIRILRVTVWPDLS